MFGTSDIYFKGLVIWLGLVFLIQFYFLFLNAFLAFAMKFWQ
jgi:hypothetical protein